MSRSVKSAKSSIKEIYGLMDSLQETVKNDIKSNLSAFDESLRIRLSNAENVIIESSRAREAMVAGIIGMRKSIEKAQRKFSRNNNIEDLRFKRLVKREIKSNILWVFINKKQWRFKLLQYLLLISYYTKDLNFGIRGGIGFISYFIFGKGYIFFKEYK